MHNFLQLTVGANEQAHQRRTGSFDRYEHLRSATPTPTGLGVEEAEFLRRRDNFYLASTGSNGWPYVQHRGGPPGFVKVTGPTELAWVESSGNRQYLTVGHLDHDDRVAIVAVDYPNRQRMKLLGHGRFEPDPSPEALEQLGATGRVEGIMMVEVVAYTWNCPKFITPRYTVDEIRAATEPLRARIRELEQHLAAAQTGIGTSTGAANGPHRERPS